jgi:hypothetical protein
VHVPPPLNLDDALDFLARLVKVASVLDDVGCHRAHRGIFLRVVAARHVHRACDALALTGERDRLSVVAGARRDHAPAPLVSRQRRDEIEAAADLERARRVVVFVLDENVAAERVGEQRMPQERRRFDHGRDARPRRVHVSEAGPLIRFGRRLPRPLDDR